MSCAALRGRARWTNPSASASCAATATDAGTVTNAAFCVGRRPAPWITCTDTHCVQSMPAKRPDRERGYGYEHRRIRKALLPYAVGSACTRCGKLIERGQAVDLDHSDDRSHYLGFAHSVCNRRAGANKGRPAKPEPKQSRAW